MNSSNHCLQTDWTIGKALSISQTVINNQHWKWNTNYLVHCTDQPLEHGNVPQTTSATPIKVGHKAVCQWLTDYEQ